MSIKPDKKAIKKAKRTSLHGQIVTTRAKWRLKKKKKEPFSGHKTGRQQDNLLK
jgi:hypothetical protein